MNADECEVPVDKQPEPKQVALGAQQITLAISKHGSPLAALVEGLRAIGKPVNANELLALARYGDKLPAERARGLRRSFNLYCGRPAPFMVDLLLKAMKGQAHEGLEIVEQPFDGYRPRWSVKAAAPEPALAGLARLKALSNPPAPPPPVVAPDHAEEARESMRRAARLRLAANRENFRFVQSLDKIYTRDAEATVSAKHRAAVVEVLKLADEMQASADALELATKHHQAGVCELRGLVMELLASHDQAANEDVDADGAVFNPERARAR